MGKRRLSTWAALDRLARALDLPPRAFGTAGLKDAQATTCQAVTVVGLGADGAARLASLDLKDITIGPARRTERKLRPGQAAGNRFEMLLEGLDRKVHGRLQTRLEDLTREGMPNAFGPQRFGADGRAHELGRLLLAQDPRAYLLAYVAAELRFDARGAQGGALEDAGAQLSAAIDSNRKSDHRRLAGIAAALPPTLGPLARQMARRRADPRAALQAIPGRLRRMHLCAHQAHLFQRVLDLREGPLGRLLPGDIAFEHATGRLFPVTATEGPGAGLGIGPTGPLFGRRSAWPSGTEDDERGLPGAWELEALEDDGLCPADLARSTLDGTRRPLLVFPSEARLGPLGEGPGAGGAGVRLSFTLPPGAYATILIRELRQDGPPQAEMVGGAGA
jgi:tRNA pseudouridine13 synthase